MFLFMSQHPAFDDDRPDQRAPADLRRAPVPEALIKLYNGRGIPMQQGYGLTETHAVGDVPRRRVLSGEAGLGRADAAASRTCGSWARTVGSDAAFERRGVRRGPNVMKGYWNRPEATRWPLMGEGWFHTGDIGYSTTTGSCYSPTG